jgi:hypothetical protein
MASENNSRVVQDSAWRESRFNVASLKPFIMSISTARNTIAVRAVDVGGPAAGLTNSDGVSAIRACWSQLSGSGPSQARRRHSEDALADMRKVECICETARRGHLAEAHSAPYQQAGGLLQAQSCQVAHGRDPNLRAEAVGEGRRCEVHSPSQGRHIQGFAETTHQGQAQGVLQAQRRCCLQSPQFGYDGAQQRSDKPEGVQSRPGFGQPGHHCPDAAIPIRHRTCRQGHTSCHTDAADAGRPSPRDSRRVSLASMVDQHRSRCRRMFTFFRLHGVGTRNHKNDLVVRMLMAGQGPADRKVQHAGIDQIHIRKLTSRAHEATRSRSPRHGDW